MDIYDGHHSGDLNLTEDAEITGLVSGSVFVQAGCHLAMRGLVAGDLIVEKNGRADIHGMVNGTLVNNDGVVELFGMVDEVHDTGVSRTKIAPLAAVRGRHQY